MSQLIATPNFDVANIDALANSLETATADLTSGGMQYISLKKVSGSLGAKKIPFQITALRLCLTYQTSSSAGCVGRTANS